MSSFQSHFERLELKFLIDEISAERIRAEAQAFCTPDRHSATGRRAGCNGYSIDSLYLDTPALAFHAAKERGDADRIKLRIRTYSAHSKATLEIKRRRSNVIDKRRAVVAREQVSAAVHGRYAPEPRDAQRAFTLNEFARTFADSGAHPKLNVRYEREAYESTVDGYARVTFDRNIRVRPTENWDLFPDAEGWVRFDDYWRIGLPTRPVVLELKCETSVPLWMSNLIRKHELTQTSFSKYSIGTSVTQWLQGRDVAHSRSMGALR